MDWGDPWPMTPAGERDRLLAEETDCGFSDELQEHSPSTVSEKLTQDRKADLGRDVEFPGRILPSLLN